MHESAASAHRGAFFRSWLKDPLNVASIVPSGVMLARQMAKGIDRHSRVLELGAGTGTLTQAILARGVEPANLYLVERHPDFADILRHRFPNAPVLETDADAIAARHPELVGTFDFVISGLPILWFERDKKRRTLESAFAMLRPAGCVHQFTYLGPPPVGRGMMRELGIHAHLLSLAPLNFPPAYVYRFMRAA
jgi:phospholipid N-methyltransferase